MNEEEKIQELLKPRYKVIADYPNSSFAVDDIIIIDCETADIYHDGLYNTSTGSYHILKVVNVDKYPHIFRKLEWWEERKVEEMPEYVKVNSEKTSLFVNDIHKVKNWWKDENRDFACRLETKPHPLYVFTAKIFIPATESEYKAYTTITK